MSIDTQGFNVGFETGDEKLEGQINFLRRNGAGIASRIKDNARAEEEYRREKKAREERAKLLTKYDSKIERFRAENPGVGFRFGVIGEQGRVDELAEKIKDGNLTEFVRVLSEVNNIGVAITPSVYSNKIVRNPDVEKITPKQWRDWEEEVARDAVSFYGEEGIKNLRKLFHIQPEDKFSNEDVAATTVRCRQKLEAEVTHTVMTAACGVLGEENVSGYFGFASQSTPDDPFILGDEGLKKKWRDAMEGPNGVLNKNFIFDQESPFLPGNVSADQSASLAFVRVQVAYN